MGIRNLDFIRMSSWINPKIVVGDASPKGRGLFAKELIERNEIITIVSGRILPTVLFDAPPYDIWDAYCFAIEKGFCVCPVELDIDKKDGIFMINHSCDPNCGLRGQVTFVAIKDIKLGEEVTYDYAMADSDYPGKISEPETVMKCLCGSSSCRGFFTGDDWRRKDLQEKYKGYFSPYIQEMIDELNQV